MKLKILITHMATSNNVLSVKICFINVLRYFTQYVIKLLLLLYQSFHDKHFRMSFRVIEAYSSLYFGA